LTAVAVSEAAYVRRPLRGRLRVSTAWLGAAPFLLYTGLFLFLPTVLVAVGAFSGPHGPTLANLARLSQPYVVSAFLNSLVLSAVSASVGAVVGSVLAYAVATGSPDGILRRLVTAFCGVLSQFGGVTLAFAFIATIGTEGFIVIWLQQHGIRFYPNGVWLFSLTGLTLIYTYFEIPLMVIVFMPALDGIRPQWREATETLGGGTWHYWRHVAGPLLMPAFLGAWLLLFANAFSAYATAAALLDIGGVIVPLQISRALSSEVGLDQANFAAALALGMVVIVAIITVLYARLQRRSARWLPR
jgi:putative spermidine/putrescine transport system permease protein